MNENPTYQICGMLLKLYLGGNLLNAYIRREKGIKPMISDSTLRD